MEPCREKTCLQGKSHVRLKPTCSDTETRWKIKILHEASLDILLSNKQITKALIRLRGCTGWSAPLLFACNMPGFPALRPISILYMLLKILTSTSLNIHHNKKGYTIIDKMILFKLNNYIIFRTFIIIILIKLRNYDTLKTNATGH